MSVNRGIDRKNVGAWLTFEVPFAKRIFALGFHDKQSLFSALLLLSATGVNIPLAVDALVHFGCPNISPNAVTLTVWRIYPALPGLGHFLHTYVCDGNPIPTFQGEPERVAMTDDIDAFTAELWDNLNADNKISLFVRYTDLATREYEQRILNKHNPKA